MKSQHIASNLVAISILLSTGTAFSASPISPAVLNCKSDKGESVEVTISRNRHGSTIWVGKEIYLVDGVTEQIINGGDADRRNQVVINRMNLNTELFINNDPKKPMVSRAKYKCTKQERML